VDMKALLFARKEEESKAAIPKDRRAHADDDGKRGGARLVAGAITWFGLVWLAKAVVAPPTSSCITIFVVDETINGDTVNDDQIQAWQEQAREGLDVEGLSRRGRPRLGKAGESPVIPVRMDAELLDALTKRAEHDGVSRSEAIRNAVRAWTHAA